MNILIPTIWFERGQSYISYMIRDALISKHRVVILARQGIIVDDAYCSGHGFIERKERRSIFFDDKNYWNVPNLIKIDSYEIPQETIKEIIEEHNINAVIFNEEYDFQLVGYVKNLGVKVIGYVDFFTQKSIPKFGIYDALLCSSLRTYTALGHLENAFYVPWGVDLNIFKPSEKSTHMFFHNAGWLGTGMRKGTLEILKTFPELKKAHPDFKLLIHTQKTIKSYPDWIQPFFKAEGIDVFEGTLRRPGMYNAGKIYVAPSKIEGLGLHILEALASGLPVITTDAPPMNEYVQDGRNGLLVKARNYVSRSDHFYSPQAIIDENDLRDKMEFLATNEDFYKKLRCNAIKYAKGNLNWKENGKKILEIIDNLK